MSAKQENDHQEKDQETVSPVRAFFHVIKEYWVDLVKLNLIFVVCCIPVVTIPAALCALCGAIYRMEKGQPVRVFREFLRDVKRNFLRAMAPGLVAVVGLTLFLIGMHRCVVSLSAGSGTIPLLIVLLLMLYVVFSISMYSIPMAAVLDLRMGAIFKNAFILMLSRGTSNLLALLLVLLLTGVLVATSPFTLPFLLCTHISLCGLISMSCAEKGIAQCTI